MALEHFEDAGWTEEEWAALDRAVAAVVERTARVRGVVPDGGAPKSPYGVLTPTFSGSPLRADPGGTWTAPLRLERRFVVADEQRADRALVHQLATRAAHELAGAEDVALAWPSAQWHATDQPIADVGASGTTRSLSEGVHLTNPDGVELVAEALEKLRTAGHYGPYTLLAAPKLWKTMSLPASKGGSRLLADTIERLLEGGTLRPIPGPPGKSPKGADAIDGLSGLVLSLGRGSIDLVQLDPPHVSLVAYQNGDLVLRVTERLVLRLIDKTACVVIRCA